MRRLRRVRGRRAGVWMALAGTAGLLAVAFTLRAAAQPGDGGWVVVARTDLPAATVIDAELSRDGLTLAPVPAGLALPGLLRDPADAIGRRTSAFVSTGEPLTQASLGGSPGLGPPPLAPGQRAVSVPLSAAGVALGPGARVDVVASTGEGLAGRTEVVVADAEVLADVRWRGDRRPDDRGRGAPPGDRTPGAPDHRGVELRPRGPPARAASRRGGHAVTGPAVLVSGACGGCGASLVAGGIALAWAGDGGGHLVGGDRRRAG